MSTSVAGLLHLPTVLLSQVCSHLTARELLVTLAVSAQAARNVLSPECFAHEPLDLDSRDNSLLLPSTPPSPFYARVLHPCRLSVSLTSGEATMDDVLRSLHRFPSCAELTLYSWEREEFSEMRDVDLHRLFQHPSVLSCTELEVTGFTRWRVEGLSALQQPAGSQPKRTKRQRRAGPLSPGEQFDLSVIHLPHATSLSLRILSHFRYLGGAAFLTTHIALRKLEINLVLCSASDLTEVFEDSTALPQLTDFALHDDYEALHSRHADEDVTLLVAACARTVLTATGGPRPITRLALHLSVAVSVVAAAALLLDLADLQLDKVSGGWLRGWRSVESSAFSRLQKCVVHSRGYELHDTGDDMLPFLQSMAAAPLQRLHIDVGQRVTLSLAVIAEVARLSLLEELTLDNRGHGGEGKWMDWTQEALFVPFSAGCLSRLRTFHLDNSIVSAAFVVAISAAAPNLRSFKLNRRCELTCHPAVVFAIVGGYCEHIELIFVHDRNWNGHRWSSAPAAQVTRAYQAAVAAAGRGSEYKPFTELGRLHVTMCWCTHASVWHALLSLLRHARRLRCLAELRTDDPLAISALSHLPCLSRLSAQCYYPKAFTSFLATSTERTSRRRYQPGRRLSSKEVTFCQSYETCFRLVEEWEQDGHPHIDYHNSYRESLLPHTRLFADFQATLSDEQQAVLARWARHEWAAGDEQLYVAELPVRASFTTLPPTTTETARGDCLQPPVFHELVVADSDDSDDAELEGEQDVQDSESDEEKQVQQLA